MQANSGNGTQPLVFFQLNKIDEAKRLVYGRAVQEVPDRVGEIFDYETSKPNFQAWSASQFGASMGKSNGNVRAMHKDVSAGIVIPGGMTYHDDEKAIDLCAKIIDDQEWAKVISGAYTGFSIGGRYAKKWEDPDLKKTRYTADPSEVSLVDRPCIPTATFFEIQKADGTLEKRDFAKPTEDAVEKKFEFPKDAKKGDTCKDDEGAEHEHDGEKWIKKDNKKAEPNEMAEEEYDIKAEPADVNEFCKLLATGNVTFQQVLESLRLGKIAEREDTSPKEGKAKYGNVHFADAKNKKYPLDTEEHVKVAASYWGMGKNKAKYSAEDQASISAAIAAAEKKFGIGEGKGKVDTGDMTKADIRKNLSHCAEFSSLISALCSLQERIEYEEEMEGDDTDLPARLMNCIVDLGDVCSDMVKEEVMEHAEGRETTPEAGNPVPMAMAEAIGSLKKRAEALRPLIKYGARHSAEDAGHLQKAHDALNAMGAKCNKSYVFADDEPGAVTAAKDTVNVGSNKLAPAVIPPNDKAEPTGGLEKAATELGELRKIVEQLSKDNEMLKRQPMPATVRLRAVGKGEDLADPNQEVKVEMVKDAHGKDHDVATLIKSMHKQGGEPLFKAR